MLAWQHFERIHGVLPVDGRTTVSNVHTVPIDIIFRYLRILFKAAVHSSFKIKMWFGDGGKSL
jgi:hypothetical protein